jgi:Ubiquitin-conjugating enzyme/Effector-associated domain 1
MSLTVQQMQQEGLIEELADCFDTEPAALALLARINVKEAFFRLFNSMQTRQWWDHVCREIGKGIIRNGLDRLVCAAADVFPGNQKFEKYQKAQSKPENRGRVSGNIKLTLPANIPPEMVLKIIESAKNTVLETGGEFVLNLGSPGSSQFHFSIDGVPPEDVDRIAQRIARICAQEGVQAEVTREPYNFRDYYSDPLTAEGPDGRRFELEHIRASTPVRDVARGVMNSYQDDVWPATRTGQKQQAVVDRVTPEGTVRLDPRNTLHDAGVRPGDTLRVSPERTAGAVDPLMREEALARVRVQVLGHAAANPGFEVEANSLVAPTEYLFRFRVPSFAPPASPGQSPRRIEQHEVLLELPPDFPIKAPEAWWQTDIFHPNIRLDNGWVCLGALKKHYKPGLDFGDLCKMLVDIAAYRTYTVDPHDYVNSDAYQWALSSDGQIAIERAGGFSLRFRLVAEGQPAQPLRIRKVER